MHIAAPVPHAAVDGGDVQTLPVQHPEPHEFASHVQTRFTHSCPTPHAALDPHVHVPDAEHPSPDVPHVPHVAPAGAHSVADVVVQTFPTQHPFGQDVALQTHDAIEHTWPDPQAVAPPHVHVPVDEHPSAVAPHGLHVPPPAPHSDTEGVKHCDPEQQPPGHVVALQLAQLPPLQNGWLPWHELQAPPPAPQYVVVLPVSHWLPLQQPLHDVLSHSHMPPEQCCPVAHGNPVPHMQAPVVGEQLSDVAPHDEHIRP